MSVVPIITGWFATFADGRSHVDGIARLSDDTWAVAVDGGTIVTATLDEAGGRLGLVAGIANPAGERRERVLEGLLGYSALWRRTGGVRAAMVNGEAQLIVELPVATMSEASLHRSLDNFLVKVRTLAGFVAGPDEPAAAQPDSMIRL